MRWLFCVALLLAFPACGQSETSTESAAAEDGVHSARGEVKAIDGERVDIDHEEIPGVMPAMQMPFFANDVALLEPISVGDRVEFQFAMTEGRHVIRSIRKL